MLADFGDAVFTLTWVDLLVLVAIVIIVLFIARRWP